MFLADGLIMPMDLWLHLMQNNFPKTISEGTMVVFRTIT